MEEEKFLKETPTMSNPSAMVRLEERRRSSPSDPTPQDHVLAGHASFRSWCSACVRGRGRAERHRGDGHKEDEDGSKIAVLSWD